MLNGGRKGQEPRRPLLLPNESRNILESISNNLKKSATTLKSQQNVISPRGDSPDFARHDNASVGNVGLSKASNVSKSKKPKDLYTSKAFDEIRKTLHPYNKESGSEVQDASSAEVNKAMLQQLTENGYTEDKAILALRSTGNTSIEAALEFLLLKLEGKNGIHKTAFGFKPGRKNSLGTNSPGSDSASTRSESPLPSLLRQAGGPGSMDSQISTTSSSSKMSRVLSPTMHLVNGTQTPPPVPPRLPLGTGGVQAPPSVTIVTPSSTHSTASNQNSKSKLTIGNSPYSVGNDLSKNLSGSLIQTSTPNIQKVSSTPVSIHSGNVMAGVSPLTPNCNDNTTRYESPGSVGKGPQGSVTIRYQQHPPPPYPQPSPQQQHQQQQVGNGTKVYIHSKNQKRPSYEIQLPRNQTTNGVQINVSPGQMKPAQARSAYQPQIVKQKVNSTKVSKPNAQIAQAPATQSPSQVPTPGKSFVSSVETHVNSPVAQQQQKGKFKISITGNSPNTAQVQMPNDQRRTPDHYSPFPNQRHSQSPLIKIQIEGGYPSSETAVSTPQSGSPHSFRTMNQSPGSVSSTPSTSSDIPDRPPPPYPGPTRPLNITDRIIQGNPLHPQPVQIVTPIPQNPQAAYGIPQKVVSRPADIIKGRATAPPVVHQQYPPPQHHQQPLQFELQPPLPPRVPLNTSQVKPPPPPPPSDSASDYSIPSLPPKHETDNNTEQSDTDFETMSQMSEASEASTQDKRTCTSPIPERKESEEKDILRRDTLVRNYSPQAFKFYMEQHIENLMKNYKQRQTRRVQLEKEMAKVNLSDEAQHQMRRMLQQKESNYIRMKRSKMNKDMFEKIKPLGVGAFGEVALVRKRDLMQLYAMKTLRKLDVLKRNQVAHVKAERDILAEADNEWVVKLYYSFQDRDNLYFVMDYVPGGDLMGLLIKLGIFEEKLARFYIAELVVAIESVHKMGFIHRDIKPDNILIDRDGHIKLTDFGLCTGFRWTHNSKYYQKDDIHSRQDSMDINCTETPIQECRCNSKKPLERRKLRDRQRCLAHSLVGTPNYIAPEVLLRMGYTSCCDWWSVGVIMYEMLVGQPPFYAQAPSETQFKVIHWEKTLRIPPESNLSPSSKDLILRLCCGAENRLGRNGANEIKAHPYFGNVKFDGLRKQPAIYVPKISHPMDTSNFDPVEEREEDSDSENDRRHNDHRGVNGTYPEHAFFEFTFKRFFDDGGHPYPTVRDYREREGNHERQHVQENESNSESNSPVYV